MLVSVVERQTFFRCHYRWSLQSESQGNLEAIKQAPALQLGTMVHHALGFWGENPDKSPVVEFARISKEMLEDASREYVERHGFSPQEEELAPLVENVFLGMRMMENYVKYYPTPLPKRFKIIQVEQRTIVAVPGSEHWGCPSCYWDALPLARKRDNWNEAYLQGAYTNCPKCNMLCTWVPHYLRGTMDSFVQDQNGKLYVLERKTYAIRPTKEKLQVDDQQLAYVWILGELFGRENIGGVLYDGLWKKAEVPKTVDKRKGTIEDLFFRDVFIRRPAELDKFGAALCGQIDDMATAEFEDRLYTNRRWEGCYDCGVERICRAYWSGEDHEYVIANYFQQRRKDDASGTADQVDE